MNSNNHGVDYRLFYLNRHYNNYVSGMKATEAGLLRSKKQSGILPFEDWKRMVRQREVEYMLGSIS